MSKSLLLLLTLLISVFSVFAEEQNEEKNKKIEELEQKLEELSTEVEILKMTTDTEQKEEKFKIYGFFGSRFQDADFDNDGSLLGKYFTDNPTFSQTHLNLYFQFNPIKNWKVLSEIRFLYAPKGMSYESEIDESTALPYKANSFIDPNTGIQVDLPTYPTGDLIYQIPVQADGTPAILVDNFETGIDLNGDGMPDLPPGFYPVDFNGNHLFFLDGTGNIDSLDPILIASPVVSSISMFEKDFNTYFVDVSNGLGVNWGGVKIERAWMEWTPYNYFNVRFGKFFTPFGIWNVDHGLPVLVSPRVPYVLKYMPESQVGLQTYGTIYLPHTDLDYYLYVTNGRGDNFELNDNNENKSVGGRLRLNYSHGALKQLSIGGSAFFGVYTEDYEYIKLKFDIMSPNSNPTLTPITETLYEYEETTVGVDFKLQAYGFEVQTEYLYRTLDYTYFNDHLIGNAYTFFAPEKLPDINAYYVQGAYTLPFDLKGIQFTPYGRYENIEGYLESRHPGDLAQGMDKDEEFNVMSVGLNVRQNPYVVYKLDYTKADYDFDNLDFSMWTLSATISF